MKAEKFVVVDRLLSNLYQINATLSKMTNDLTTLRQMKLRGDDRDNVYDAIDAIDNIYDEVDNALSCLGSIEEDD